MVTIKRSHFVAFVILCVLLIGLPIVYAWTGPGSSPPNSNVFAPVHVGAGDQFKTATLGVNSLVVDGNAILSGATRYLNFNATPGSGGYGFRDNAGVMEFKNSGGSWQDRNTFTGNVSVTGNITAAGYFHNSDARLKSAVHTAEGLAIISRLRGVEFLWNHSGEQSAGVIAQEVERVLPAAVRTDTNAVKSVEYDQITAYLIEAVKEQQQEIDALSREIDALRNK